jgi:hypothetical protein
MGERPSPDLQERFSNPMASRALLLCASSRQRLIPAILFAAAFAAVVAFANRGDDPEERPAERVATAPAVPAATASSPAATQVVSSEVIPAPRRKEPTAEQLQAIDDLKQQVTASTPDAPMEEREERGNAIREVSAVSGPQAIQGLIAALRVDSDRRNRILAIEGLRRAAAAGDPGGAIRDALREASTSGDEVIAEHAREAYDAIAR